jgi:hypothetical protein
MAPTGTGQMQEVCDPSYFVRSNDSPTETRDESE